MPAEDAIRITSDWQFFTHGRALKGGVAPGVTCLHEFYWILLGIFYIRSVV